MKFIIYQKCSSDSASFLYTVIQTFKQHQTVKQQHKLLKLSFNYPVTFISHIHNVNVAEIKFTLRSSYTTLNDDIYLKRSSTEAKINRSLPATALAETESNSYKPTLCSIPPNNSVKYDRIRVERIQLTNNTISNRTAEGCETFLISFDIYQIESSSKIKETGVRSEQTKRFGAESWLCRWWSKGRASSLFDPGAQIPGVITNKFSTRNEVRKRERVNPKVRAKGVRTVDTRQTEDPWGQWGKRRKGESVERERKITLGFRRGEGSRMAETS